MCVFKLVYAISDMYNLPILGDYVKFLRQATLKETSPQEIIFIIMWDSLYSYPLIYKIPHQSVWERNKARIMCQQIWIPVNSYFIKDCNWCSKFAR